MSNYWKKKMEELEQETKKRSPQAKWDKEEAKRKHEELQRKTVTQMKQEEEDDIAPVMATHTSSVDDIGPVDDTWFRKGLFADGWDYGDGVRTILGTTADAGANAAAGVMSMGESAIDAAAMMAPSVEMTDFLQNGVLTLGNIERQTAKYQQSKAAAEDFVKQDLYDEAAIAKSIISDNIFMKTLGIDSETASVLGNKSDALIQSGGQLLATAGLAATGLPWWATTAATSFGREAENALKQGATFEEAGLSAVISAGAEILSEKLSGGIKFGGKTVDDALLKPFIRGISNKTVRLLANAGIDAVGEGAEEVISGVFSALGQKLTYMDDKELGELFTKEDAADSFIGGAVMGGLSSGFSAVRSGKTGYDHVTGLSQNEQMVVDRVVNDRIAEAEGDGKKLSAKEKRKIYDAVVSDMDKGYINTDTIEEVLSGDSYKSWQQHTDFENQLTKEIEGLENMPKAKITVKQSERLEQAREELAAHQKKFDTKNFKTILSEKTAKVVNGSRLAESYNERTRRGKVFEADPSKYDENQKTVIQKTVDSGVLNNTNRSHELVDMIAKISADKGVPFDFTNNEKLKESGFAVEGKQVNGYITKDGVTINVQSPKYLQSTVGHEVTHIMEGTEFYDALKQTIFDYAKTKGEYQSRYDSLTELYKDIKDADIEKELTAELVGDYMFQNEDFVNHLSTANRNVFQKIYDEVKYLCKVVTAGSKEARELEKVKRAFEKAYKESGKPQTETKYSLSETTDGRFAAVMDNDILSNIDTDSWDNAKKNEAKKAASEALKKFSDGIVVDGITRKVNRTSRREYTRSNYTEQLYNNAPDVFADKMRAADVADDIVIAATNWQRDGELSHPRTDDFVDFDHGKTLIVAGDAKYSAEVVVGITSSGDAVFYDVVDMTPTTFDTKKAESPTTATTQKAIGDIQGDSVTDNVAQKDDNVKYSLSGVGEEPKRYGNYAIPAKDLMLEAGPVREDITPASLTNPTSHTTPMLPSTTVSETESVAPVAISETETTTEESSAVEDLVPDEEEAYQQARADSLVDAPVPGGEGRATRRNLHNGIINNIRDAFKTKGFDLDQVFSNAKSLSTFKTVDNTPQRVMEKALGYKEGQILADITVNKVAQNETEGIKWLNSFTDRKNGLLAQISRQYNIKPGSKESEAAQMYAEGFYVNEKNEIIKYGDGELAADFPDVVKQAQIKGLARDERIRKIYDDTLKAINESRTRNAYPEIPRLENYFLHFRAMNDTFSRLGLPFNPNDIRAKDLPTDLNGVTADLKPGQPYFASAQHRTGKRTSFDLLGGLEQYLTSAKNQIYHIDDIQTLRALRNYIADTYGQANGLEDLDALSEEEQQQRIEQVYGAHLSTFAKFLNEEANVLAGKTALIDRGLEGIIGRRGMTFLDAVNRQVGSNMVGYNISSSLTNFLAPVQAFAKTNKAAFVKGMAQFVSNKVNAIHGNSDGFAEQSPVMIRRRGAERFNRTLWQKLSDPGYALMSAVDDVSTELIARAKYNEFVSKGMDTQQAHIETDKWVSRLMGDRSLGQQPQLYNSKMLGIITKFQLEVRNQLDSQFYDTIQEAKVSNEHIEDRLTRNAMTAAKVTSTFVQLAIAQHLFGKAFESVAGYNPAFDIISAIIKTFGWDDDEESEDTVLDNIEQGFFELLEDMPYASTFTGGRIPISSALPISELINGEDQYGNEKSRWETFGEAAPYYLMPGGYGQLKKTAAGLGMFDLNEDHPIAGSYTDSGNLRFPVKDTPASRAQASVFGQYASKNAGDYFDGGYAALNEKQIQEFTDSGMSIQEYWKYREGLSGLKTLNEKADYIASLDLETWQKNVLVNNLTDRSTPINMEGYENYSNFEEFDFATRFPEKYKILQNEGISVSDYKKNYEEQAMIYTDDISAMANDPESYAISKVVTGDVLEYKRYTDKLGKIKADKDADGKTISGSKKQKVIDYINTLDIDYGQRIILYRSMYSSKEDRMKYNQDIVDYLNSRDDISYEDMVTILQALDFTVMEDGTVEWD